MPARLSNGDVMRERFGSNAGHRIRKFFNIDKGRYSYQFMVIRSLFLYSYTLTFLSVNILMNKFIIKSIDKFIIQYQSTDLYYR